MHPIMSPWHGWNNILWVRDLLLLHGTLNNEVEVLPGSNLLAIELTDSGGPTLIRGTLQTEDSSASEDGIELSASTCNISKAGDGGPLFDDNGNFVGMNLFLDTKRGAFMQRNVIIEKLEKFEKRIEWLVSKSRRNIQARKRRELQRCIMSRTKDFAITNWDILAEDLDSLGYPKPLTTAIDCGMVLVNSFEEIFGDTYDSGKGVWGILKETISKDLSQSVVSLASYNGETRYFACSGIIIEWNGRAAILTSASLVRDPRDEFKIWDNLKIDVLLPDKQHTEGTLQHCHLHYNVAIVSFNSDRAFPTMSISDDRSSDVSGKAVAVGRCFESGMLMTTKGLLNQGHRHSLLDCNVLWYSSCEITKAGIGGPLIDFKGRFIGTNFYDEYEGTPFLPQSCVRKVLEHFEKKRFLAETDGDGYKNRWPVPMPYWCHQDPKKEKQERKERVGLLFRKQSWAPPRRIEALPTC
ncbi:uncharacterized protein [Miscanthus floridulus]